MASKAAIGKMEHSATVRIKNVSTVLADYLEIELAEMPSFRDPAYQQAANLDTMAGWLETIAAALDLKWEQEPLVVDATVEDAPRSKFAGMSAEQLAIETDVRRLTKPDDITDTVQWAAWLDEQDAIREAEEQKQAAETNELPSESKLKRMTLHELIDLARSREIELATDATKSDIIKALEAQD